MPATQSHDVSPIIVPPIAPNIIATPVSRVQNMHNVIGSTAEPIRMPMNKYTHPSCSYNTRQAAIMFSMSSRPLYNVQ